MAELQRADGAAAPDDTTGRPPPWYRVELPLVLAVAIVLSVAAGWQELRHLTSTVPVDQYDPEYVAWQLAWVSHAAWSDPAGLWTTPAYDALPDNLAMTDASLGYIPLGWITSALFGGGVAAAVALLNLAMVMSSVLAFGGAYALARVWGARISGALLAGAAFALTPWRLVHINHLYVLSYGGIALALALLCRGHGWTREGLRPERASPGWLFAGWLAAAWQLTMGFTLGISFMYVLAGSVLLLAGGVLLKLRRAVPWRLVAAEVAGAVVFGAVALWMARPFQAMLQRYPDAPRLREHLERFSPRWPGFFLPPELSAWFGDHFVAQREALGALNERLVPPGIVLILMALLGLLISSWPVRRRLWLALAITVAAVLTLGVNFPGHGRWTFLVLWYHLPGWEASRTPGRLVVWVILGLSLLAAGAVTRISEWLQVRREARFRNTAGGAGPLRDRSRLALALTAVALVIPAGAAAAEGMPRSSIPLVRVVPAPDGLADYPGTVAFLPSRNGPVEDHIMLWGTEGWPRMLNGAGSFDPPPMQEMRARTAHFPSAATISYLRGRGVRTVVIVLQYPPWKPGPVPPAPPVTGLGITRTDHGWYALYHL